MQHTVRTAGDPILNHQHKRRATVGCLLTPPGAHNPRRNTDTDGRVIRPNPPAHVEQGGHLAGGFIVMAGARKANLNSEG